MVNGIVTLSFMKIKRWLFFFLIPRCIIKRDRKCVSAKAELGCCLAAENKLFASKMMFCLVFSSSVGAFFFKNPELIALNTGQ